MQRQINNTRNKNNEILFALILNLIDEKVGISDTGSYLYQMINEYHARRSL